MVCSPILKMLTKARSRSDDDLRQEQRPVFAVEGKAADCLDQSQRVGDRRHEAHPAGARHAAGHRAAIGAMGEAVNAKHHAQHREGRDIEPVADLEEIGGHCETTSKVVGSA